MFFYAPGAIPGEEGGEDFVGEDWQNSQNEW